MIFTRKQVKRIKISLLLAGLVFFAQSALPHVAIAAEENYVSLSQGGPAIFTNDLLAPELIANQEQAILDRSEKLFTELAHQPVWLPLEGAPTVVATHYLTVTAYSSEERQTDSTPFTTGWQTPVRDGVAAINFLPFGSVVRFPEVFGDKPFVVEDRMNVRYPYRADIWMLQTPAAKAFGLRYLKMEVLGIRFDRDYVLSHFAPAFPGKR